MDRKSKVAERIISAVIIAISALLTIVLVFNLIMIGKSVIGKERAPSVFGIIPLVVLSGSMSGDNANSFNAGDLVLINSADASALAENEVIAYYEGDAIITHRIARLETDENGETVYVTKGDANDSKDINRVTQSSVIGVYGAHFAGLGNAVEFMQTPIGMLIFIGIPIALYLTYDVLRRRREVKIKETENARLLDELKKMQLQAGGEGTDK